MKEIKCKKYSSPPPWASLRTSPRSLCKVLKLLQLRALGQKWTIDVIERGAPLSNHSGPLPFSPQSPHLCLAHSILSVSIVESMNHLLQAFQLGKEQKAP